MFKKLIGTAAFATVLGVTGQAEAITIDSASYTAAGCLGTNACVVGGAALTAGTGTATFIEQNFGGAQGLGINLVAPFGAANTRGPEIQGDGGSLEQIAISFATAQIVTEIALAQFYNSVHFGPGEPDEIAQIFINGALVPATLQVFNDSGGHTAVGFDPGAVFIQQDITAGLWRILNPFGNTPITSLVFNAADTPIASSGDNSDYTIALVETSDVPEPTTLGIIGIGLIGLGLVGRRRRRSVNS